MRGERYEAREGACVSNGRAESGGKCWAMVPLEMHQRIRPPWPACGRARRGVDRDWAATNGAPQMVSCTLAGLRLAGRRLA